MTIEEIQNDIIDEFSMFEDWEERYQYMIDLGKTLPLIAEQYKTEDNIIKGCQSKVWVHANMQEDKVNFTADSDAIITKGIIAILIRVFSNQHPKDIIDADTKQTLGCINMSYNTDAMVMHIRNLKKLAVANETNFDFTCPEANNPV